MQRFRLHLLVACALLLLHLSGLSAALTNDLLGLRFRLAERPATGRIAVVAIDAPSIESAGIWPWPRKLHAQLIDRLRETGADDIAFDVDFSSASAPEQDQALEDALTRSGGSVALPTFVQSAVTDGQKRLYNSEPLPRFAAHAWGTGVNIEPDRDGIVRRYAVGQALPAAMTPSLATMVAGREAVNGSTFLIDFGIDSNSIPVFSFKDILADAGLRSALKDKKVIVGATAIELGDRVTVPGGKVIPGVVLQALAAESLLQGRDLTMSPAWVGYLCALLLVLLVAVLQGRSSVVAIASVLVAAVVAAEGTALLLQRISPVVIDTAPLDLAALVCTVVLAFEEINIRGLLARIAERRFQRVAMSIADGLICADTEGRITMWNPAAEAMFGYSAAEMIGAPVSAVLAATEEKPWSIVDFYAQSLVTGGMIQDLWGQKKDGSSIRIEASISAWDTVRGLNYSLAVRDVTVRRHEEERIRYLAEHDILTGLLNRSSLVKHLTQQVSAAAADGSEVALLLIDLDRFKEINDTLGHASGDMVLRQSAERLVSAVGSDGIVARLGGDEFAVIISAPVAGLLAERVSLSIVNAIVTPPLAMPGAARSVAASIGAAIFPRHGQSADALMADADLAMYRAKADGGGRTVLFDDTIRDEFDKRVALADELRRALDRGEFELFYQPQIDLRSNRTVGAEALIRWNHPQRGLVPPGEFIPLLNTLPISNDVSLWIMRTACRQARQWQLQGREMRVSVNLSPAQFQTMNLPQTTAMVLAETGLPPGLLELEVTEDIVIVDDAAALESFRQLSELGIRLAWDDFGTGYGSLAYLKKFPLNRLKIDQTFVRQLRKGTQDFAIVECTIVLGKALGLSITAEGIEKGDVMELLTEMGCDEGQGYLFSRPVPALEFHSACPQVAIGNVA